MKTVIENRRRLTAAAVEDRRGASRNPCGEPIWWKGAGEAAFQQGWLIERSDRGAVFLARGRVELTEGDGVELSTSTPTDIGFHVERGTACRVQHVHADLYLIAAELKRA
jgi:hypothetical protein